LVTLMFDPFRPPPKLRGKKEREKGRRRKAAAAYHHALFRRRNVAQYRRVKGKKKRTGKRERPFLQLRKGAPGNFADFCSILIVSADLAKRRSEEGEKTEHRQQQHGDGLKYISATPPMSFSRQGKGRRKERVGKRKPWPLHHRLISSWLRTQLDVDGVEKRGAEGGELRPEFTCRSLPKPGRWPPLVRGLLL